MVKPIRALLLLGYTALLLSAALYLLPPELKLSRDLSFKSFTVRSLFEKQRVHYADISDIKTKFAETEPDTVFVPTAHGNATRKTPAAPKPKEQGVRQPVNQPISTDTLPQRYLIQYGEADTALFALFRSLNALSYESKLIRVLHYGDSQLEGDRITSSLRQKIQGRFGGCGVGLVPLYDPIGARNSIIVRSEYPWHKIFVYGNGYRRANPNLYGVLGSYYTYSFNPGPVRDSLTAGDSTARKKWQRVSVDLYRTRRSVGRERYFERLKILYRNTRKPFELSIRTKADTLKRLTIPRDSLATCSLYEYEYPAGEPFEHVKVSFGSSASPAFFGLALDCKEGVAVDNIAFRGSSGIDFGRMNRDVLACQLAALNVKCIILQYGVNVVPYEAQNYKYYEHQFYKQLRMLRELAPDVSILVVGVSDMSRKEGEIYVSYPNIEKIRDAQRRAAFRAGCAFWDLYEAMGGKNSMPSWVFATPALANKDFTHFTPKGAQLVSEMLYKAIVSEYEKFNSL
jgi:lysophospholipase L1-like esterase